MANSTDVHWEVNGFSIQTLAYNITTYGGDRFAPPKLRGSDLTIPYKPGQVFQDRVPDSRSISLDMWVIGADIDGRVPTGVSQRAEFEKNLKFLRELFWNQGKPIQLTKRWKNYGSSVVQSATATAIFSDGLIPSMSGGTRATFSVDLFLPDPFFYGPEQTINFSATATSTQNATVLGDYETTNIVLDVNASRNNFRLTNASEGVYVNVNENVSANSVRLDVEKWTATRNPSGTPSNVISKVTQFGHVYWMVLRPGLQVLTLSSSSGSGSGSLKYRPRWL